MKGEIMDKAFTDMLICDSCSHKRGCGDLPSQKNRCDRYRKEEDSNIKVDMRIKFDSDYDNEFDYDHYITFLD
jgi:hypothetical protein